MAFVRNILILLTGCMILPVCGAEPDDFFRKLPDPVALQGERTISRAQGEALLRSIPTLPEDPLQWEGLLKQKIMESCYRTMLGDFLKKEGFDPAKLPARQFLSRATGLPENAPELTRAAEDPETALRLAWQCYLAEKCPEVLQISDREVERFYRDYPEHFRRPARGILQTIRCPDAATAQIVRFRLQQGQSPAQIAAHLSGVHFAETPAAESAATANWQQKRTENGAVLLSRLTVQPGAIQPLQEASGQIRSTLLTRRSAQAMSGVLQKLLAENPVKFFF